MPASAQKQIEVAKRRARVLTLKAAGFTLLQIAEQEDAPYDTVKEDLRKALADARERRAGEAQGALDVELAAISSWQRAVEMVLRAASAEGDREQVLAASDRLLRISKRRAQLMALDGSDPVKPKTNEELDELKRRRDSKLAG